MAAAARVPVAVRHGANPLVILRQALQRGVDGLFFRADQAHLDLAVAEGKHLRPQHRGVGDAHQLELLLAGQIAGDDEEPRAVGRAVDVGGLDGAVNLLLLRVEPVEVQFRGRRQGLDDVFERIMIGPGEQVEQQRGDFRVGEELRINMPLLEVFGHRMVIGEVAVVHQRHVDGRKRMGAAGMPDAALGREPLVGNPFVGAQLFDLVIFHDGLGIADHLENHDVPAVREHEGPLLAQRRVIFLIEAEAVLVDEFVFGLAAVQLLQIVFRDERIQHVRLDADEIAADIRRHHFQAGHGFPVVHLVELRGGGDIEIRRDELLLRFPAAPLSSMNATCSM